MHNLDLAPLAGVLRYNLNINWHYFSRVSCFTSHTDTIVEKVELNANHLLPMLITTLVQTIAVSNRGRLKNQDCWLLYTSSHAEQPCGSHLILLCSDFSIFKVRVVQLINIFKYFKILILKLPQKWFITLLWCNSWKSKPISCPHMMVINLWL